MAGEPRRSGRATKGQHTKNQELEVAPQPKRDRKSKKSKTDDEEDEEEDSIIRCICGATEDDDGWMMISCEKCTAWQHNLCMGITEDQDKLPEKYFCEQCRPSDHKQLLEAMKRGEKPWEERIEKRKAEENVKSKKGKKGGKPKSQRQSAAEPEPEPEQEQEPKPEPELEQEQEPKPEPEPEPQAVVDTKSAPPNVTSPSPEASGKRKFDAVETTNGHSKKPSVTLATTPVEITSKRTKADSGAARRPSLASPVLKAEAIDQLPKEREGVAKALTGELKSLISKSVKDGSYKVPSGSTIEATGLHFALSIEHALHVKHRGSQASSGNPYLEQFRSLRFNLKKNETLLQRLLSNALTSETLVEMSSEELASEELQKERAAIKEEVEKQSILTHEVGPRYRKTHKGDEIIGEEPVQKPTEEYVAAPIRRRTIEHQETGPIDTGSPPPGTDLPEDFDHPMTDTPHGAGSQSASGPSGSARSRSGTSADVVMRDAADDPELDRLLNDDAPPRPTPVGSTKVQPVWRGRLSMNSVGSMNGSARLVAGEDVGGRTSFFELLGQAVEVDGRIATDRADTYVSEMRNHGDTTSVCVLQIQPNATAADQDGFNSLWRYFMDRSRWGVISQRNHETVRDVYVVPIDSTSATLPRFLNTLQHNTIRTPLQGRLLLMAIVVRKRGTTGPNLNISIGTPTISTPVNQSNPQFSPVTTGLPVGMAPPHGQHGPLSTTQTKPVDNLAIQILGPLKDAPVVSQILSSVGSMSEIQLQNLRDILEREPGTRDDIQQLSDHLQRRQREMGGA